MRVARLLPLVLAALLCSGTPLYGQSQAINGSIEGTITDPSGSVLPGVTASDVGLREIDECRVGGGHLVAQYNKRGANQLMARGGQEFGGGRGGPQPAASPFFPYPGG